MEAEAVVPLYKHLSLVATGCGCMSQDNPGIMRGNWTDWHKSSKQYICRNCNADTRIVVLAVTRFKAKKFQRGISGTELDKRPLKWMFQQFDQRQLQRLMSAEAWEKYQGLVNPNANG